MTEGWHDDEYLVRFSEDEVEPVTERYGPKHFINGFRIVGLRGWDDFILQDTKGKSFTMPTVPIAIEYLKPFMLVIDSSKVRPDSRFTGKVKRYAKPPIFGGDPQAKENMTWIDFQRHADAVQWWNQKNLEVKGV
jgi:hypothetical protein